MSDTTERCEDCGHPLEDWCDCECCGLGFGDLYLMSLVHDYLTGRPLGTLAREATRGIQ